LRGRQRPLGTGEACLIRHRMAGLDHGDVAGRPAVAVPGDGDTGQPRRRQAGKIKIMYFRDLGHGTRGLAGGEHDQPAARRRLRQVRRQALRWVRRRDRGAEQRRQELTRCDGGGHGHRVWCLESRRCGLYLCHS